MKTRGGASKRVSFENPGVRDAVLRGGDALPIAGRIAQLKVCLLQQTEWLLNLPGND